VCSCAKCRPIYGSARQIEETCTGGRLGEEERGLRVTWRRVDMLTSLPLNQSGHELARGGTCRIVLASQPTTSQPAGRVRIRLRQRVARRRHRRRRLAANSLADFNSSRPGDGNETDGAAAAARMASARRHFLSGAGRSVLLSPPLLLFSTATRLMHWRQIRQANASRVAN
jgi:hypothetical protein